MKYEHMKLLYKLMIRLSLITMNRPTFTQNRGLTINKSKYSKVLQGQSHPYAVNNQPFLS